MHNIVGLVKPKASEKVTDPPHLPEDLMEIIIQIPPKKQPEPPPKKRSTAA